MRKKNTILKSLFFLLMLGFGIYNVMQAVWIFRQDDAARRQLLLERIGIGLTEQAVSIYMPGLFYTTQAEDETVILEDESTCESILEMNGRTLAERLLGENQGKAVEAENEAAAQKEQSEDETQDTVETVNPVNPLFDISLESLRNFDYLLNHFFVVDPNTTIGEDTLNIDTLMEHDLTMQQDNSQPQILIYHTHSQEQFVDSDPNDTSTWITGVGDYLTQILTEQYGYQVLHDTQTFDIIDGEIDRSKAYNAARDGLLQILEENPSIEVIIDLHRDGVSEDKHLVTDINGKPTAQIMYFNGLSYTNESGALDYLPNDNVIANLAFSFRLEYEAAGYYPTLTRCVYLKGYRYNLDLRPKSILLEVGAQTNTVEEARNAMEPFAYILNKVLKGE
ncbi:stage II sporulation protein P [Ruminococcus sp. OA3]|uniref:stage II sporulation protein P n=1 Tax=Ruminococcus sp. OA3 TaxID=2914164 RepID=UPI001F06BE59|nr:stage II sporulation protein P [Ruminococcus sp. OA3]MCH1982139.1 stage II sporulation protein P [Ruminococcus sp. OA3]